MCRLLLIIMSLFLPAVSIRADVVTLQKEEPIEAFDMDTPAKPYSKSEEVYDMDIPQRPNKKVLKKREKTGPSFGQITQAKREEVTQNNTAKEIKLKNMPKPLKVEENQKSKKQAVKL